MTLDRCAAKRTVATQTDRLKEAPERSTVGAVSETFARFMIGGLVVSAFAIIGEFIWTIRGN